MFSSFLHFASVYSFFKHHKEVKEESGQKQQQKKVLERIQTRNTFSLASLWGNIIPEYWKPQHRMLLLC